MARKWSQTTLARKVGVSRGTISDLENDNVQGTTHILDLAKALNLTPQYIEDGKGSRRPEPTASAPYVAASSLEDLAEKLLDKGPDEVWQLIQLLLTTKR